MIFAGCMKMNLDDMNVYRFPEYGYISLSERAG
jgi:hypothetical protein